MRSREKTVGPLNTFKQRDILKETFDKGYKKGYSKAKQEEFESFAEKLTKIEMQAKEIIDELRAENRRLKATIHSLSTSFDRDEPDY